MHFLDFHTRHIWIRGDENIYHTMLIYRRQEKRFEGRIVHEVHENYSVNNQKPKTSRTALKLCGRVWRSRLRDVALSVLLPRNLNILTRRGRVAGHVRSTPRAILRSSSRHLTGRCSYWPCCGREEDSFLHRREPNWLATRGRDDGQNQKGSGVTKEQYPGKERESFNGIIFMTRGFRLLHQVAIVEVEEEVANLGTIDGREDLELVCGHSSTS